jgi:hypothetical protein
VSNISKTGNKRTASYCILPICFFKDLFVYHLEIPANANDVAAFANSDGCMVKLLLHTPAAVLQSFSQIRIVLPVGIFQI